MTKHFDVTLIFSKGGSFGCRFYAESKVLAKQQALSWARQSGFVGSIKKTEIIELTELTQCSSASNATDEANPLMEAHHD